MIAPPSGTHIWIAAGYTDMRRGFDGLAARVQQQLEVNPFSGHVFIFRGRRGDRIKLLWFDGDGLCLFAKRLEPPGCGRMCAMIARVEVPFPPQYGLPIRRIARANIRPLI